MSNINLLGVNKETFGTKMPNVFLERVELNYINPDEEAITDSTDTSLTFNLSIKFTKPEHFQIGSAREFIEEYLGNVYLYAFLTYKNWIKRYLEEDRFSIEYWHTEAMLHPSHHPYYASTRFRRIALSWLVAEDNPYNSKLIITPSFDEDGNEIIEITNIILEMKYRYGGSFGIPNLSEVENLMFMAYTGVKASGLYSDSTMGGPLTPDSDDGLFSERYSDSEYSSGSPTPWNKTSSNSYFSDITYYHVLKNNRIATKFYEAYTTAAGIPYFAPVLQSTNGNFYSTDNYSFEDIKAKLETLNDTHLENRELDSVLDANIKNLESIINSTSNKNGVLLQLSSYRATYPNKSPRVLSGQFYSEFVIAFAEILQTVQQQEQLIVKQLYDGLVIDYRQNLLLGTYNPPNPSGDYPVGFTSTRLGIAGADVKRGFPYESPSDCYIPKKWFLLARKAWMTNTIATYSDEELQELYGALDAVDYADGAASIDSLTGAGLGGGADSEFGPYFRLMVELQTRYIEAGFPAVEAADLAKQELSYYFATNEGDRERPGAVRSELLNPTLNGGEYLDLRAGDALVKNQGSFLFDYEKALRTQTMIAHVLDLSKLQLLFRINVPYEHFYVKRVELSRNELRLDAGAIDSEHDKYIRTKMQLNMRTPSIISFDPTEHIDYPKNNNLEYKYFGGKDAGEETDTLAVLAHKLKYCRPHYKIGSVDYNSTLKFVNFDIPVPDDISRLKFYNTLDQVGNSFGSLVNERVLDGYRLMAFKFEDVMDDDVAYYNTQDTDDEERLSLLEASNNLDEARTCYSITIEVEDQTQLTYDNLVEYIKSIYDEFAEYYEYAVEACSFNNLKNEFNQFFIDQVNEIYPGRVWVKAAYVTNALSEVLFAVGQPLDESLFEENILETILKIAPETGNLFQLTSFANQFKTLVNYLSLNEIVELDSSIETPAFRMKKMFSYTTPGGGSSRIIQFYNEKPIWEPIAGDITPGDIPLSDFTVGDYSMYPEFVISKGGPAPLVIPHGIPAGETYVDLDMIDSTTDADAFLTGEIYDYSPTSEASTMGITMQMIELIFFPGSDGIDDDRLQFYNLGAFAKREGPFSTSGISSSRLAMATAPNPIYGGTAARTWASWFLDAIMSYSTMDLNVIASSGGTEYGRLKSGIDRSHPFTRRDWRNAVSCLVLVNELLTASSHYAAGTLGDGSSDSGFLFNPDFVSADAGDLNFFSQEYKNGVSNALLRDLRAYEYPDLTPDGPGGDAGSASSRAELSARHVNTLFQRMALSANQVLIHLKDILQTVIREEDINAAGDYKLRNIFSADDPIGPTTGTLGNSRDSTAPSIDAEDIVDA